MESRANYDAIDVDHDLAFTVKSDPRRRDARAGDEEPRVLVRQTIQRWVALIVVHRVLSGHSKSQLRLSSPGPKRLGRARYIRGQPLPFQSTTVQFRQLHFPML